MKDKTGHFDSEETFSWKILHNSWSSYAPVRGFLVELILQQGFVCCNFSVWNVIKKSFHVPSFHIWEHTHSYKTVDYSSFFSQGNCSQCLPGYIQESRFIICLTFLFFCILFHCTFTFPVVCVSVSESIWLLIQHALISQAPLISITAI